MRAQLVCGVLLLALAGAGGCRRDFPSSGSSGGGNSGSSPGPVIPKAKDVKRIRIVPKKNLLPGKIPAVDVTEQDKIEELLGWLRGVDWSKKPGDIRTMDLPPLSPMDVFLKDDTTLRFSLVPGGGIV